MAISHEPKPKPSELDYVPQGGTPYKVTDNDSWRSLAERADVKAAGMNASDLCYYNFKTRTPSEINWYLHNKVGCRRLTRDGRNYMFSVGDSPGVVYLPRVGHKPLCHSITPKRAEHGHAWAGIALKAGTQFAVVGIETVVGLVVSLEDPKDWMVITASVNRVGPGWGASGGVAGIYIVGVSGPADLKGYQDGGWDFSLALGPNWGALAKSASTSKRLKPLVDALVRIGARTPSTFKRLLKTEPDRYGEMVKSLHSWHETADMGKATEPKILMVDIPSTPWIPTGGGAEVSAYFGVSNFEVVWDNL